MDAARRKKILYRSWHRGCKETDLLLGGFVQAHMDSFNEADLLALEALIEQDDWNIYAWIIGREEAPEAFNTPLMRQLKASIIQGS